MMENETKFDIFMALVLTTLFGFVLAYGAKGGFDDMSPFYDEYCRLNNDKTYVDIEPTMYYGSSLLTGKEYNTLECIYNVDSDEGKVIRYSIYFDGTDFYEWKYEKYGNNTEAIE